ncbi:hypothetical protein EJ02DRAFT_120470 [Clathrospora elynae]|uniref:Uncharacterized protein n=1 Tax=Clathrospora elynae TaxID=706981 RepID=A0A6A5SV72_9PLEO|nr:hypothetical protein EJ02DRAFT_120470 [Clathrospora elynae]
MAPTSIISASILTLIRRATPILAPTPTSISIPQAPPAYSISGTRTDDFSPVAIIGIVAAILLLVISVPLIAILLRRYERKRLCETVKSPGSSNASLASIREDHSLRSILVTKELSRSSVRMERIEERNEFGLKRPEKVYGSGGERERERAWSKTEVCGGEWK